MDRLEPWVRHGIDRGREALLGPNEAYRRILDEQTVADVLDDRRFRFLSRFGNIHYFRKDDAYLVTGFEEADHIFKQDALFPNVKQTALDPYDHLLSTSPEMHDRTAAMIRACLTKKVFNESSDWVRNMSKGLFDALPVRRKFDWYRSFAMPSAYFSACRIFGFEDSGASAFHRSGDGNLESTAFYSGFREWCLEGLREAPSERDERLLNTFRIKVAEGSLTEDEALELILVMFHGALKTTSSMVCVLSRNLIKRCRQGGTGELQDETVLTKFIEESVRLDPVLPRLVRTVDRETTVFGVPMKRGATVYLDVRAANRDGRRFEVPEEASLRSNHQRHLSFGAGLHQCIGMHMARHNARMILTPLVDRAGSVRILASKWVTDTHDVYFYHPHYMVCRRV